MGTNMAFLFIRNEGLTRDALAEKLRGMVMRQPTGHAEKLAALGLDPEALKLFSRMIQDGRQRDCDPGNPGRNPFLAYAAGARWLPYFDEALCRSGFVTAGALMPLSARFEAPVLAFSIYDSDAVELFFCDAQTGTACGYGTSVCPGMIEFEDGCSQECPLFLADLLGVEEAQIQAAWNQKDLVFADDIMAEILELMGAQAVFDASEDLPGYEKLYTGD